MYIDSKLKVSSAQVVTASAASTDVIDLAKAGDLGVSGLKMMINVDEAAAAAGAATVQFSLQCDNDSAFGSPKTVILSDTIGKADLVAGKQIYLPIPVGMDERYLRVYYTVATGPLTAGKFTAAVVESEQASKAYPANQV